MLHFIFSKLQDYKKIKPPFKIKAVFLFPVIFILIIFPFLVFSIYHLAFWQKVYPFISVAGQNLSGKTRTEAAVSLNSLLEEKAPRVINLVFENKNYWLVLPDLSLEYNIQKTVDKSYFLGREDAFLENIKTRLDLWQNPRNLSLNYNLNEEKLETFLATVSAQINQPAIPATINVVNKNVVVEPGKPGQEVDTKILKKKLAQRIGFLEKETVFIPTYQLLPPVSEKQAEETKARAEKLIGKSLTFEALDYTNALEDKELINFLSFTDSFDEEKVASWAGQLATSINTPPQNALFRFEAGRVLEFKPAKEGLTLNQAKTTEIIINAISRLEVSDEKTKTIKLPILTTPPAVKTADVNNLGIRELVSKGESWFWGSIASRIHNIQLASSKFNGVLIPPNEEFSFNKTVGEIDQAHGFKQAYIIKEGRTVLGDGGGVCQVSTTLFRAALNAGLPILERRAHAYRVSYYEQNTDVGQDATVFAPSVDLKIKNDTPAYILIQTKVDVANRKLTFEFYGTGDGREVYISKSRIWDQVPPPPDLYQDDPSLPAGTVKQIDWAAWGAKTAFDWKVTRGGEVLQEKTFYSNYRPWQAVFLRGTGGQ